MQAITTIGFDIAKSVFQVHGVDAEGNVILRRQLKRRYVLAFFQKLPPCLVGIEACAWSHHWSRELQALGHTVRLMPPAYAVMTENVHQLRPKPSDSEKITINLGYVDLGHIDLMVQDGFYSNRTDFIRTAIRNQLERHAEVVKQSTARKNLNLGLRNYSREDLEEARRTGRMLDINVLGLATIEVDVTPELARATIASVVVLGALHASPEVKAALADRMR